LANQNLISHRFSTLPSCWAAQIPAFAVLYIDYSQKAFDLHFARPFLLQLILFHPEDPSRLGIS